MRSELDGYVLDRMIGDGAGAEVWLAWAMAGRRPVAIKRWHAAEPAEAAARCCREVEALTRVAHPALVSVREVIATPDGPAVVMDLAEGGSVADLIEDRGTLAVGQAGAILAPVADTLEAMHRAGIVHGDVKPSNILLDRAGAPLLADPLGFAPGEGTPGYLDPAGPGPEADTWALAVTAYEMLCGVRPHRGCAAEIAVAARRGAHRPLGDWPGIAPEVASVVEAALSPDRRRRPGGPSLLVGLIAAAAEPSTVSLPGPARHLSVDVARRARTVLTGEPPTPAAQAHVRRWPAVALAAAASIGAALAASAALAPGAGVP